MSIITRGYPIYRKRCRLKPKAHRNRNKIKVASTTSAVCSRPKGSLSIRENPLPNPSAKARGDNNFSSNSSDTVAPQAESSVRPQKFQVKDLNTPSHLPIFPKGPSILDPIPPPPDFHQPRRHVKQTNHSSGKTYSPNPSPHCCSSSAASASTRSVTRPNSLPSSRRISLVSSL